MCICHDQDEGLRTNLTTYALGAGGEEWYIVPEEKLEMKNLV